MRRFSTTYCDKTNIRKGYPYKQFQPLISDAIKESIFWLTFRKAIAHRNQMNTPAADCSFPTAATSSGVTANTESGSRKYSGIPSNIIFLSFCIASPIKTRDLIKMHQPWK